MALGAFVVSVLAVASLFELHSKQVNSTRFLFLDLFVTLTRRTLRPDKFYVFMSSSKLLYRKINSREKYNTIIEH